MLLDIVCELRPDAVVVFHINVFQLEKRRDMSKVILQKARGIWMTDQDGLRDIDDVGLLVPDNNIVGAKVSVYKMSPRDKRLQCHKNHFRKSSIIPAF